MKMKNNTKSKIINQLKQKHDYIVDAKKNDVCFKQVQINLPVTLLERTFFDMVADSKGLDQTKMFKKFIHALMKRNPDLVEQAKQKIYADSERK